MPVAARNSYSEATPAGSGRQFISGRSLSVCNTILFRPDSTQRIHAKLKAPFPVDEPAMGPT
jgi:hypothetical protein